MAYGFLRRVFEVFERFTHGRGHGDDVRGERLGHGGRSRGTSMRSSRRSSEFAEVSVERNMSLLCAVGDRAAARAGDGGPGRRRARGGAAPDDLAGRLAAEHHGCAASGRPAACDGAAARGVLQMRVLIVGYGKMGRMVEELAAGRGIRDRRPRRPGARRVGGRRRGHRLLDGRRAAGQFPAVHVAAHARGDRHDWLERSVDRLRAEAEQAGIGVVASGEFFNRRECLPAHRGRGGAADGGSAAVRRWIHEIHHAAKRDAPSGTALLLRDAMIAAGFNRPIDMSSARAGMIPGTHTVGFDSASDTIELIHRARDRRGFASGALLAARWIHGRTGWYQCRTC